jgi:hypothetical protein
MFINEILGNLEINNHWVETIFHSTLFHGLKPVAMQPTKHHRKIINYSFLIINYEALINNSTQIPFAIIWV